MNGMDFKIMDTMPCYQFEKCYNAEMFSMHAFALLKCQALNVINVVIRCVPVKSK